MKNTRAFTLIEIMIALFIFAIMSAIIATVLYTVFNTREDSQAFSARLSQLQFAVIIIENDIEQIIPKTIISQNKIRLPALIGDTEKIEFTRTGYTNPDYQFQRSQLQRVEYYVEDNKLIRQSWDSLNRNNETKTNKRVLLDDVDRIHIEYLAIRQQFFNQWPSSSAIQTTSANQSKVLLALPKAIKIDLHINNWGQLPLLFAIPAGNIA